MNKRLLIVLTGVLVAGAIIALLFCTGGKWATNFENRLTGEQAESATTQNPSDSLSKPAALVPLDLSRPVRLAIGGLGLSDDGQNQQLGGLITTDLTGAPGFDLVERQSLNTILRELNLTIYGFVRAKDAVRVGRLLKVDWFLLGTEAKINGTNSIVIRVVEARTGIMRDAGVVQETGSPAKLAGDIAAFVRQSRQNAAQAKTRVYLAIGAFEDLSINDRQSDFPSQLRGYLTAAYQGANVTLLEREYVETLLQEVDLDLAGLTEADNTNPPPAMQSAFWVVTGQYQSYETTNFQVEVNLQVCRIFGRTRQFTLRGLPGEPVGRQIKTTTDQVMNQNAGGITPTRVSEARLQMAIGKETAKIEGFGDSDLVWIGSNWDDNWRSDPQLAARQKRNFEEAMRAFETVLLLEPTNRPAKMYLAGFLRTTVLLNPADACKYYREIIEEPVQDKWSGLAQQALVETLLWSSAEEKLRWLQSAAAQTSNPLAKQFYLRQAESATKEVALGGGYGKSQAIDAAETKLFKAIHSEKDVMEGKSGSSGPALGMKDFAEVFGNDKQAAANHLVQLLPRMEAEFPELKPYLLAAVVTMLPGTNSPVVAEFKQTLEASIDHPDQIFQVQEYWGRIRWDVYDWCFEKTNYPLAVTLMEGEQHAASTGVIDDFGDQEKIKLAYAYLAMQRWQDALGIFESFTNRPVRTEGGGPWGEAFGIVLTDKMAARCREKLGLAVTQDPRKFEIGKPVLCLCAPSTFAVDDNGLWVGIGGQLLHLDFDLNTNLMVSLPMDDSVPVTILCVASSDIWIGTDGAGLIEYNKASRQCHHFTETDGLMMNSITSLHITGDSLWIGYGSAAGGGLGRLDLSSKKLSSLMPSLISDTAVGQGETPPQAKIKKIVTGADDNLLMLTSRDIRQFDIVRNVWGSLPDQGLDWLSSFATDSGWLAEGGGVNLVEIGIINRNSRTTATNLIKETKYVVTHTELEKIKANLRINGNQELINNYSPGRIKPSGRVAFESLRDHHWQTLKDADGMPNPPSVMTLDGNDLWVGGEGYIALADLTKGKILKYCHIQAQEVDRIQIAAGYVWAQFDWHLYRAPLSDLH